MNFETRFKINIDPTELQSSDIFQSHQFWWLIEKKQRSFIIYKTLKLSWQITE